MYLMTIGRASGGKKIGLIWNACRRRSRSAVPGQIPCGVGRLAGFLCRNEYTKGKTVSVKDEAASTTVKNGRPTHRTAVVACTSTSAEKSIEVR